MLSRNDHGKILPLLWTLAPVEITHSDICSYSQKETSCETREHDHADQTVEDRLESVGEGIDDDANGSNDNSNDATEVFIECTTVEIERNVGIGAAYNTNGGDQINGSGEGEGGQTSGCEKSEQVEKSITEDGSEECTDETVSMKRQDKEEGIRTEVLDKADDIRTKAEANQNENPTDAMKTNSDTKEDCNVGAEVDNGTEERRGEDVADETVKGAVSTEENESSNENHEERADDSNHEDAKERVNEDNTEEMKVNGSSAGEVTKSDDEGSNREEREGEIDLHETSEDETESSDENSEETVETSE